MNTRNIDQSVTFEAGPHEVYEALMDSSKHAQFTGAAANISPETGGQFTAYDGLISGTNRELVPGQRIVQSWRISTDGWPEDHYSTVVFSLDSVEGGTRLTFTQTGVPAQCYDNINQGWHDHYWEKLKQMLQR